MDGSHDRDQHARSFSRVTLAERHEHASPREIVTRVFRREKTDPLSVAACHLDAGLTMKLCLASSVYAVGGSMQGSTNTAAASERRARDVRSGGARHREAPRQSQDLLPSQLDIGVGKAMLVRA